MIPWRQVAMSEEWQQFWSSDAIRKIKEGTTRMLTHGRSLDPVAIARLQSRLQVIEEIEALPTRLAQAEEEQRDRDVIRRVAAEGPRRVSLPRID